MVLPVIKVEVEADTDQAEAGLNRVKDGIENVGTAAPRATSGANRLSGGLRGLGNVSRQTRARIQNTSFQLQDLIVQLQGGTQASRALAQQVPQLLGAWGAVGATLGAIAGISIPAVAIGLATLRGETAGLEDRLDELDDIMDLVQGTSATLALSLDDLILKYGEAAQRVRDLSVAQAELAAENAARRLADQFSVLSNEIDRFSSAVESSDEAFRRVQYQTAIGEIASTFQVARAEAEQLLDRFNDLDRADTFEQQQVALQALINTFEELDIPLSRLPEELRIAVQEMITLSNETDAARAAMDRLAASASQVGVSTGTPLFERGLSGEELLPGVTAGVGVPETDDGGRRRRGGGGRSGIEALIDSLQTEQETIEQFRQEGLELLAQANAAELEAVGGQNEAKLRLQEEYMNRLRALQQREQSQTLNSYGTLFGNLSNVFAQGSGNILKVSKAFSIAQGLINSYRAYTEVLADPSLIGRPFLRTALAASTLASGLAQVASIRSVSDSVSGGAVGGGGGGAGAAAGGAAAAPQGQTFFNVNLTGEGNIGRGQVRGLIEMINEEIEDGAVLGGIRVSGA